MKRLLVLGLVLAGSALGGCSKKEGAEGGAKRLNVGGSSFVAPMMKTWSAEYNKAKGVEVNYASKGSGAGVSEMIAGTLDFGCTDAPMTDGQLDEAKKKSGAVVHIPLVMGAVVPAFKLDGVEEKLTFSGPVLADIFLGKIKKWNDKAIQDLNPGVKLPEKDISVAVRNEGSGTTDIFTDYLSKVSPEFKEKVGRNVLPKWPEHTVGNKGNEGVAGYLAKTDGAIGYVELIYALKNNIKYGKVQNKEGNAVNGSLESVSHAAEGALTTISDDLRYSLTDAPGKESYPIAGTVWAVVYVDEPADKKDAIVNFLTWVTHDGQQYCEQNHYAKLPKGLVEKVDKKLAEIKVKAKS